MAKSKTGSKQLNLAKQLFEELAGKLGSRISVRLWDDTVIPLGANVEPGFELSISGPGVIGSLIRKPTPENLLIHYAKGHIDYHGTDFVTFLRTARVRDSRKRGKSISKSLLAKVAWNFLFARDCEPATSCRFDGDDTGNRRTRDDDRKFIQFHYDVGNDFYKLFLDKEMVYTCAYFKDWDDTLEQAQLNKLDLICRKLQLQPGDRMLDIGCGWGALICYAAEHYGVHAHGVTLSEEQIALANQKIKERGLEGKVTAELRDYNDVQGPFDKIASIGMAEHVGIKNTPNYMSKVKSLLTPGGLFLNHAITRPAKATQREFQRKSKEQRLLTKYIFPGGELDHQGHVLDCMESTGMEVHDVEGLRDHYGLTCQHWSQRLESNREQAIAEVGEEKYRMWQLYLAGVCMALTDGSARIFQTVASNKVGKGHSGMPPTRQHIYQHELNRAA